MCSKELLKLSALFQNPNPSDWNIYRRNCLFQAGCYMVHTIYIKGTSNEEFSSVCIVDEVVSCVLLQQLKGASEVSWKPEGLRITKLNLKVQYLITLTWRRAVHSKKAFLLLCKTNPRAISCWYIFSASESFSGENFNRGLIWSKWMLFCRFCLLHLPRPPIGRPLGGFWFKSNIF